MSTKKYRTLELELILLAVAETEPQGIVTTQEVLPYGSFYLSETFDEQPGRSLDDAVRWALIYMTDELGWFCRLFGKLSSGNSYERRSWIEQNRPEQKVNQVIWQITEKGRARLGSLSLEYWLQPDSSSFPPELTSQFNPTNIKDTRNRFVGLIIRRSGQKKFKEQLLYLYENRCAITETTLEQVLDAAHIIPYKGRSTNHPSNGILLRSDIHRLFDTHLIVIDTTNMTVMIAPELIGTIYEILSGKSLRMPHDSMLIPNTQALDIHRKKAYWLQKEELN